MGEEVASEAVARNPSGIIGGIFFGDLNSTCVIRGGASSFNCTGPSFYCMPAQHKCEKAVTYPDRALLEAPPGPEAMAALEDPEDPEAAFSCKGLNSTCIKEN